MDRNKIVFWVLLPIVIAIAIWIGMRSAARCASLRNECASDNYAACIDYDAFCVRPPRMDP